jgi:hypothetical protein
VLDSAPAEMDEEITKLAGAIAAATEKGQFSLARDLSDSLKRILVEKRRSMPLEQRTKLSKSNASLRAHESLEEDEPSGPLLAAIVSDPRFGSLRRYCDARGITRSSLSAYATGRSPCPMRVDAVVRRDFPHLKFDWPKGLTKRLYRRRD